MYRMRGLGAVKLSMFLPICCTPTPCGRCMAVGALMLEITALELSLSNRVHNVARPCYVTGRFAQLKTTLDELTMDMVNARKKEIGEYGPTYFEDKKANEGFLDVVDVLLSSTDLDGKPLADIDICDQCITFISAGHGTTASAVAFTLYCLAQHKDAQQKCFEEARSVLAEGAELDVAALKKLKYIEMCYKEATRLYPPVRTCHCVTPSCFLP